MEENLLIDKYLRIIEYAFRWTGLHLRNRKNYNMNIARCVFWFNFIWLNSDVAGAFCWFQKEASKGDSLVSLTYAAPSITLALLGNCKSLSFMWYHEYVDNLVLKLRELETKANLNSNDRKTLVERPIKFLHFVIKVANFLNWVLIVAFPSMPLCVTAYNYFILNKVDLVLPFFVEYPFDAYDIRIWPFVVLRHIWDEVIALFWMYASESFYYICTTLILIQFRLLQHDILQIIPERNGRGDRQTDEEFQSRLIELVTWHQELIEAVQWIETIYSKSTLFNFVSSSAMICLTGFNVTTIDDLPFVVMFLSFLVLGLVQIFFLCFFGDMIMTSNKEVSEAVYNCNWYMTTPKKAKDIHFLQMRAQKLCKLTAYGFADVNLTAFSKILNSAFSYFALLKTVSGPSR